MSALAQLSPTQVPGFHAVWLIILTAAFLALFVSALVTLYRSRGSLRSSHLMVWTAVIVLFPFLGSIVWLAVGRPGARRSPVRPLDGRG